MRFPLVFEVGELRVSGHFVFELAAYMLGFALFRRARRREDTFEPDVRWTLVIVAIVGAVVGAKVLHHLANPSRWAEHGVLDWVAGKTIVGGLLGGLVATELWKRRRGISARTGDVYALPLAVGIAIGRLGCFSAGLHDGAHGSPSDLPWALDLGDGITRHPAPLYEIAGLALIALWVTRPGLRAGEAFRRFFGGYMALRVLVDALKPVERFCGLGAIQWAALAGVAWSLWPRADAALSLELEDV